MCVYEHTSSSRGAIEAHHFKLSPCRWIQVYCSNQSSSVCSQVCPISTISFSVFECTRSRAFQWCKFHQNRSIWPQSPSIFVLCTFKFQVSSINQVCSQSHPVLKFKVYVRLKKAYQHMWPDHSPWEVSVYLLFRSFSLRVQFSVKWFNSMWEVLEKPENHHQNISIKRAVRQNKISCWGTKVFVSIP